MVTSVEEGLNSLLLIAKAIGERSPRVAKRVGPPRPPPGLVELAHVIRDEAPNRSEVPPDRHEPDGALSALS
jgi:hypothetical protein